MVGTARLKIGQQGRVVIPAAMRQASGIDVGTEVLVRVEAGRIVLETRDAVLARIHDRMKGAVREPSVVDELIAERRAEARRELGE